MSIDDFPYRLDKTAFKLTSLDAPSDEKEWWLSKTPAERLGALEFLRQLAYGYDPATTRLQRVLEITQLERG
jgi:hypothetical protein